MLQDEQERKGLTAEEAVLWDRHRSGNDRAATEELIEIYHPIARKLAAVFYGQRHDNAVEFGDYLQYARIGLLEAIERFVPGGNASFTTFATYRIRGAILSGLEHSTEVASQRTQRRRLRRERLKSLNEADHGSKEAFVHMVDMTLHLAIGYLLEESAAGQTNAGDPASDPYLSLELKQLRDRLVQLLETLPARERSIVRHHYFENMEFAEIGLLLGVSKGRLSQLHARALRLLREGYEAIAEFNVRF